ncbi:riboflavin biosynthesis protein RibF [Companilactobacillus allii]|uniref:Riboflavin biosynthesis protein n=1 Tax=Companilactobacillus allii TaxID=1847728 RepID=A0A1P8Q4C8_9LACO|nr:riboflavin biosynthesis protein RibF [Companilactobacillus allii]APX72639.1 riboflavin biosynthesis protein RibF [Companilactobacillus allii]USQ69742.1 riboflavin biosynthesis protein RibF [Companilactobacillus allii]
MKIVNVKHPLKNNQIPESDTVLIMGFFDGVHLGHQKVIQRGVELAHEKGLKSVLLTFDRSPREIYQHEENYKYISTVSRKAELVDKMGVDTLYFVEFTLDFASLKPQEFVDDYMVCMHAKYVVAGFDYTYGKKDIANMHELPKFAKDRFKVITVPEQMINGAKIGSSIIKRLILSDKIDYANELLGYNYQNQGQVVHGLKRGRTLGYPTANVVTSPEQLKPSIGVYVTRIEINGKWYPSMTSVGYNVTFKEDTGVTIETNIFNFDSDIYEQNVRVEWLHYLRGEIKFDGADGLIKQLNKDKEDSIHYFEEFNSN